MPGISRRRVNNCLAMPIGCMTNVSREKVHHYPDFQDQSRESQSLTGHEYHLSLRRYVRTLAHYDAHKANRARTLCADRTDSLPPDPRSSTSPFTNGRQSSSSDRCANASDRRRARTPLVSCGVRRSPMNPDRSLPIWSHPDRSPSTADEHHPGSPVKWESRYGLLFQNEFRIAVRDTRVTIVVCLINRVSASWQTIAVRNVNRIAERIVGYPVSAIVTRIAPGSAQIPMPDFAAQFGSQSICQRPESGSIASP